MWPDEFLLQAGWRPLLMPIDWASNKHGLHAACALLVAPAGGLLSLRCRQAEVTIQAMNSTCTRHTHLSAHPVLQVRAWICVGLIVVLRLLNLAVPILYKKVGMVGAAGWAWLEAAGAVRYPPNSSRRVHVLSRWRPHVHGHTAASSPAAPTNQQPVVRCPCRSWTSLPTHRQ